MKTKQVFLIILILTPVFMVQAQSDLDTVLKRNDFYGEKWIQSKNNVLVNTSNHRLILDQFNVTGNFGFYEDFTTYTEYEEQLDYITNINQTHFRAKCDLQYGRYLVYDYGVDYFENFTIRFAVLINGIGNTGLNDHYYFSLNNRTLGDRSDYNQAVDSIIDFRLNNDNTGDDYRIGLQCFSDGENIFSGWFEDNTLDDDWLYVQIYKLGQQINCTVYDNADYTGLHWSYNLTHTVKSPKYRYVYPVNTQDLNLYPNYYIDVWVKNLDLGQTVLRYFSMGSLYTVDLLVNETSKEVYSIGFLDQENLGTSIEKYVSDDNSTWISLNDFNVVANQNLSACYLWIRLNSSGLNTPFVDYYQFDFESICSGIGGFGAWNYTDHVSQSAVVATIEGNQTQTALIDGDWLNITETVGTPAFDARFNYTIANNAININLNLFGYYDGNSGHNVTIDAYNFSRGSWKRLSQIPDGSIMKWYNNSLSAYRVNDFVQNNVLMIRIYHHSAGNVNHYIHVDYMQARYFAPTSGTVTATTPLFLHWLVWVLIILLTTIIIAMRRKII